MFFLSVFFFVKLQLKVNSVHFNLLKLPLVFQQVLPSGTQDSPRKRFHNFLLLLTEENLLFFIIISISLFILQLIAPGMMLTR